MHLLQLLTFAFLLHGTLAANEWIEMVNREKGEMDRLTAEMTWAGEVGEDWPKEKIGNDDLLARKVLWRQTRCCEASFFLPSLNSTERRMVYLLCRGSSPTIRQYKLALEITGQLRTINTETKVCRGTQCFRAEPDLERFMATTFKPSELLWAWRSWRDLVGIPSRRLYPSLIQVLNQAARNNGYKDESESWKEELEVANLTEVAEKLYLEVLPLYRLLHGFVRYKLSKFYGKETVSLRAPIPAHLLGNLWAQSWENILPLLLNEPIDLSEQLKRQKYTVKKMAEVADDYYASMGLPRMNENFWKMSRTQMGNESSICHGTAANLFNHSDYRMILCADVQWQDLYVIVHEMGHIQYFMSYENQPPLFQDGANSAFQESIGDTIMLSFETLPNLLRLGLLPKPIPKDIGINMMLYHALKKLPHISFALIMDKWRWAVMSSQIKPSEYNQAWWDLCVTYSGLAPPIARSDKYDFDIASKFHIADNTPYIRYFLSEFFQFQFLQILCEISIHGECKKDKEAPFNLHACDLHGSKIAGQKFREMMSKGLSEPWNKVLSDFSSGKYTDISAKPILSYFQPLKNWLESEIKKNNIPLGW